MFRRMGFLFVVFAFFAFSGCDDDDSTNTPQTNVGNNGSGNNGGNNGCQCEDINCGNCKVETASCDNGTLRISYKVEGYFGGKQITEVSNGSKKCPSGGCVEDENGAHCGE